MSNNSYKTIDELMKHLGEKFKIDEVTQKDMLINTGYYHGYKGYRFYNSAGYRLPFITYSEVLATIQYDTMLKSIFYSKIMFIETALKNIALNTIMMEMNSSNLSDMYDKLVVSYSNAPKGTLDDVKRKYQKNKIKLQGMIHNALSRAYNNENRKITHFYNSTKYNGVPLWAVFEVLTMGDFGFLISCLDIKVREKISRNIGLNLSSDTQCELIYKYVFTLKDLRNSVAHNDVIYDTRFRKTDVKKCMSKCIMHEIDLPYINFRTIGDYMILICYFLKILNVSKTEIKKFINDFELATKQYMSLVNRNVLHIAIHPDFDKRLKKIKEFI